MKTTFRLFLLLGALLAGCEQSAAPGVSSKTTPAPAAGAASGVPDAPSAAVGQKYFADGPWAVTAQAAFACCDSTGNKFDIWYPSDLGKDGFKHPIITWGDGTGGTPDLYAYLLRHLASWGFIVIASETEAAHTGQEMIDAAQYLVDRNDDPTSPFFHKVAVDRVGSMGHSQGAGGAKNALMISGGFIKTAVPIELPAQQYCNPASDCPSSTGISSGSIFYVNGTLDVIISPSLQANGCGTAAAPNEQSVPCYYANTPDTLEKAWGSVNEADHNDVQGQPGCGFPLQLELCTYGVYGYLSYPTAWMMAQLQDAADARAAFVSGGDFFADSSWSNQASNLR